VEDNMEQFVSLKASAGSGKTFALSVRYISLLLLDASPTQILTLTFTNKAASQMSSRIFNTIKTLGEDKGYLDAIIEQTKLNKEQILEKKDIILERFINTELSIYTIDKFINKILREFSGYVKINDDFTIVSNDEELLLYKYLQSLNANSFDDLIDFAYTQSKKLSSIFNLFKQLYEKNEKFNISDDFDYKLYEKVKSDILKNAFIIKQHIQDCKSISKTALNAVDFNDVEQLLDKGKTWLTKETLNQYSVFKKANTDCLQNNFEQLKIDIVQYIYLKEQLVLNKLFKVYNEYLKFRNSYNINKNSLEFNDITNMVYTLMSEYIHKDFLYFRLDSNYNHILIDEFQDTSIIQYKILEPLIQELISGSEQQYKTFFYVGDTKQSIYRFRGGDSKLFDFVVDRFSPMIKQQYLDTNYRSSQNVVNFVNRIFKDLPSYEYYEQKVKSDIEGYVKVDIFDDEKESIYIKISKTIKELLSQGINPNNITILTYTNDDILNIYRYLKSVFSDIKINTELTSKLILQKNVSAIINAIKYLYFHEKIYLSNFNTLIGKDLEEEILIQTNILEQSLEKIVYTIATLYNLMDENVIKFLEIINSYSTLIDFIYEIDNDDTAMVNKEKSGLQIMTIFKSKGLEFDTVILLDRLKGANSDKSSLLFEYDNMDLKHIYYKQSNREKLDFAYEQALKKEKDLKYQDQLNIFYVALTRAKNNMIILKKEKKSVFQILENRLFSQEIGKLYKEISNNTKSVQKDLTIDYTPLDLGYQDVEVIKNIEDDNDIMSQYFGIATHYCLEMMENFDKKSLNIAINMSINRYNNILNDNDFDDIYNRIEDLINNDKFNKLVENSTFYKEQALIYNEELKIIDLLIQKNEKIIIVDYKTSKTEQYSHIKQISYYIKALQKIYNTQKIEGYLVYLQKNNTKVIKI
jgi:exodeoxyribonuclease V beta subunit